MDLNHVDEAIVRSYRELRTRIGAFAFAFPVILVVVGLGWGIEIQPTLSNYYFAKDLTRVDLYPVRLWFCGILFFVGFFLYRYQGFSKNEDRWLSAAGLFAVGVAIFPMSNDGQDEWGFVLAWIGLTRFSLHYICAILAFACIAVVIVWYADSTLSEIKDSDPSAYTRYKNVYRAIAIYMAFSIAVSIGLKNWPPVPATDASGIWAFVIYWFRKIGILLAETSGIWAFAIYWFVKNSEMKKVGRVMKARNKPLRPRTEADLADRL